MEIYFYTPLIHSESEKVIASAIAFESSVFPTPVGPKKRNEPVGRLGSESPALPRRIARETLAKKTKIRI